VTDRGGTDLLEHGRPEPEPRSRPPQRSTSSRPRTARLLVLAVGSAGVAAAALWYGGRPALPVPSADRAATSHRLPPVPARVPLDGTAPALHHDLSMPADQAANWFLASSGHALLYLEIHNDSAQPLRVVGGGVQQPGVRADNAAGGLTAGTQGSRPLAPGVTTEVFVRMAVDCATAVQGRATDQLVLLVEDPADPSTTWFQDVSLAPTGTLWDDARHAACTTLTAQQALGIRLVPGSVRGAVSTTGVRTISAVLELHDRAGYTVQVLRQGTPLGRGPQLVWETDDELLSVSGGATLTSTVTWQLSDCGAAGAKPPGPPAFDVREPEGATTPLAAQLGDWFPAAWAGARAHACGNGRVDLG
jgi:hypothetical protein